MKPLLIALSLVLFLLNVAQWKANAELAARLQTLENPTITNDSDAIKYPARSEMASHGGSIEMQGGELMEMEGCFDIRDNHFKNHDPRN